MMLECRGITVGYTESPVLEDINLTIGEGEIVTLVGANGAGKSTLVKSISGLMSPMKGEIRFDDARIDTLPAADRIRLGISHVPEGRQVFSGMTVAENLGLGAYARRDRRGSRERDEKLQEMYALYPFLRERMHDVVGNFSGGQQQMLAIARGLMSRPKLIMLDEPSLGLSPLMVAEVFALVKELRGRGLSILLSEQNARSALAIADRGYVIENGCVAMSGAASELLASPEIAERYLGVGAGTGVSQTESARMAERLLACIGHDSQNLTGTR